MRQQKRTVYAIVLLTVIAVMLGLIIVFFPEPQKKTAAVEKTTEKSSASVVDDYTDVVIESPVEEQLLETAVEKEPGGKLYIVIDDVGYSLSDLESFLKVRVPVTFAVMPGRPFSKESAKLIEEAGFDIILHQPMEPEGNLNPGTGAITTDMDEEQIFTILESNLKGFPAIRGMNNHMGSRVTADSGTMTLVMSYLKKKDMFFLDSVTTEKSVAEEIAATLGVPFARRSSVFLDNEPDKVLVEKAFKAGTDVAAIKGSAVMIGHVKTGTLIEVLDELSTGLEEKGYTFHGISSLFEEAGN